MGVKNISLLAYLDCGTLKGYFYGILYARGYMAVRRKIYKIQLIFGVLTLIIYVSDISTLCSFLEVKIWNI